MGTVPEDLTRVPDLSSTGGLHTEEMVLNVGPQHPATHGVLRVLVSVDGERIVRAEPVIGYMHRGHEKLVEQRDFRQITNLLSRMDWLSGINNEIPASLAVERLLELEVPRRAQYLRVILAELNRITNHLMFTGSFGLELGATTPVMYAFRERELIQEALELVTGGRMHFGFIRPGGLKEDVPRGFVELARRGVRQLVAKIPDYENLLMGNEIFKQRTVGVGRLDPALALDHGVSGPILRACGIPYDIRKVDPYLVYDEFEFDTPLGAQGDSFDRFWVLVQEMKESARIVEQALDGLPEGSHIGAVPKRLTLPKGQIYCHAENPLGELGYYLVSDGGNRPYRLKIRTPSFSNISVAAHMLRGAFVPDMIAILGSMFFVVGDIDR
ncbi:MAG: NADH-quinone oxidoreductase subunit [Actinomycetota bacterium]|jgi:NADH-quinone oxidoreductase subunit D|nr:NADH-quinone oxidoreductase subunit [Actinomycetota bacterium]